jgi:hypothetical protein
LGALNEEQKSIRKFKENEGEFRNHINEPNKGLNRNWISIFAIPLSIIAIKMNIKTRIKIIEK